MHKRSYYAILLIVFSGFLRCIAEETIKSNHSIQYTEIKRAIGIASNNVDIFVNMINAIISNPSILKTLTSEEIIKLIQRVKSERKHEKEQYKMYTRHDFTAFAAQLTLFIFSIHSFIGVECAARKNIFSRLCPLLRASCEVTALFWAGIQIPLLIALPYAMKLTLTKDSNKRAIESLKTMKQQLKMLREIKEVITLT